MPVMNLVQNISRHQSGGPKAFRQPLQPGGRVYRIGNDSPLHSKVAANRTQHRLSRVDSDPNLDLHEVLSLQIGQQQQ